MAKQKEPLVWRDNELPGDLGRWLRAQSEDNEERLSRLHRNLGRAVEVELTPRQRQVVELYYGREYSIPKIAMALKLNKSTVSRTLQRAQSKLRCYLKYSL